MPNSPATMTALCLTASLLCAADVPTFTVGERETLATPAQRQALGLKWFPDGNLGIVQTTGQRVQFYGANGASSVRVTGTPQAPLQKVESVTITTTNTHFRYLAGGPTYRDPDSQRLFLFYHAEIHRGTSQNFYSVIGLSVQTDADGLAFQDLGPVFTPNVPNVDAPSIVEICGAPYIIRDGHFHIYARDVMSDGHPLENNLTVARAPVAEVIQAGLAGRPATWTKWNGTAFSEPATGGRSAPLETGNPGTRWMDITYNTALQKYVMVVAAERAVAGALSNVRFIDMDAQRLREIFAPGEVSRIYLNFSDPWPSRRHAHRRLTHSRFLELYRDILRPGGEIWFKTDNAPLFEFSLSEFEKDGYTLSEVTRNLHEHGCCGVMTDYECKFNEQGVPINRCVARR